MVAKRAVKFCGKRWFGIQCVAFLNAIEFGKEDKRPIITLGMAPKIWN